MKLLPSTLQFLYDQFAYKVECFFVKNDSNFYKGIEESGVRVLKSPQNEYGYIVTSESSESGRTITKSVRFHIRNLLCTLLENEAWMVEQLSEVNAVFHTLQTPRFISLELRNHMLSMVREYMPGKPAKSESESKKIELFLKTVRDLERAGDEILMKTHVPKRTPFQVYCSSVLYVFLICLRSPSLLGHSIRLLKLIFTHFSLYDLIFPDYVLSHRDLTSENIFIYENRPVLIDLETAIWAERGTDLSLFPRFYYQEINKKIISELVQEELPKFSQRKRFIRLSSYYLLQFLATEAKLSTFYKQAVEYIPLHFDIVEILRSGQRSAYEIINSVALTMLALMSNVFHFSSPKKFILCYHSISSSPWRFATQPEDFRRQLEEILKKYSILPLNKLLSDKEEQGVSLTFDDGYEDNLSIAEPILSELAIPSTLFVLGEPESARRIELNNDIRMLTKNQIISLSRSGWEIGSHSYSHGRLLELDSKELQKEISNSKETIESWLGKDIRYFSYPKGESNNSIREMVKRSGYERAFTVAGNSVNVQEDPLQTPRISIEGDLGFRQFCALLTVPGMYYHRNAIKFLALKDGLVSWLPSFK